ncbi:hypothetical protein [Fibrisoma limi]|nr:hypothetical protein [Fibrisoma limi]
MQELTDDQLDGLFRKSAEEFEPTFDPAAWQAMQSKLDAHDGTTGQTAFLGKLLRWGLPGLLLILSGVTWYALENVPSKPTAGSVAAVQRNATGSGTSLVRPSTDQRSAPAAKTASVAEQQTDYTQRSPAGSPQSTRKNQPIDQPVTTATSGERQPQSSSRLPTNEVANRTASGRQPANVATVSPSRRVNEDRSATQNTVRRPRTNRQPTDALLGQYVRSRLPENLGVGTAIRSERIDASAGGSTSLPTASSVSERASLPTVNALAIRPMQWPHLTLSTEQVEPVTAPVVVRSTSAAPLQKGLSIRAVVSPDLSGIGLRNFSKPGTNVGLMLEYRMARRWSGQIGILHSTKIYRANGDAYEWPPYNVFGPEPATVDGRCNMLDIPINLRYDLIVRPRPNGSVARWFVSGGVTSYVMLREDYKYNYKNPNNPHIKYRDWSTKTGPYGLSQLNMSVGYEHPFSQRLSGQLEPFIKAPLRGIGVYKYNLLSTGAFLSIRYRL